MERLCTVPNLVAIQQHGRKPPLFWVHGDSSDVFLPDYLGPDQPFYGLKHQGRHGEPALYTQVETIASHYLTQLRTVQGEGRGPYFLGGYSFGGTVAFEMAKQLQTKGENVALLFMVDPLCPGTNVKNLSFPAWSSLPIQSLVSYRHESQRHLRNMRRLKPQQIIEYVAIRAKNKFDERIGKVTKSLRGILIRIYLRMDRRLPFYLRNQYILKIYYDAIAKYIPQQYNGRAIYIKSEKRSSYHALQWRSLIAGGLEVHEVTGCDHMDLLKGTNARFWAEKLKMCLVRSQEALLDSVKRNDKRLGKHA